MTRIAVALGTVYPSEMRFMRITSWNVQSPLLRYVKRLEAYLRAYYV